MLLSFSACGGNESKEESNLPNQTSSQPIVQEENKGVNAVEFTEQDRRDIVSDEIPVRFTYNNRHKEVHLNALGYKIMADLVYKKGVELGYWK